MPAQLRYGADSSVCLELRDGVLLAECGAPRGDPVDDPADAVAQALAEPLDYPPLMRCTTPADRVVLPLGPDVPHSGEIVAAVVRSLVETGVQPDGVTVLRTRPDAAANLGDPRPLLPPQWASHLSLLTHEPARRGELAYLASTERGDPILLNRAITDADVVLPIGCFRSGSAAGCYGLHSAVYPTFSDERTLRRFRSPTALDRSGRPKAEPCQVVDEVGWLLGVSLTVQVVPGPGDRILHVLAGQAAAVGQRATELYEAAWRYSVPRRASLVVATVEGGSNQQTWDAVGRALAAAAVLVEEGGAIAVCCDLADDPGPGVRQLADAQFRAEAMRWIRKERPVDALPATLLGQALGQADVYLLSRLDPLLVEDLEIAPIAEPDELLRLVDRHDSCILLANAPHTVVSLEPENNQP